jgi:hypothetical protein
MSLTLRPTWPENRLKKDWSIFDGTDLVGHVYLDKAVQLSDIKWFWALTGTVEQPHLAGVHTSGRAATLEAAKAASRVSYEGWLARSTAQRRDSDSKAG